MGNRSSILHTFKHKPSYITSEQTTQVLLITDYISHFNADVADYRFQDKGFSSGMVESTA